MNYNKLTTMQFDTKVGKNARQFLALSLGTSKTNPE
jgi:hypothetical protein